MSVNFKMIHLQFYTLRSATSCSSYVHVLHVFKKLKHGSISFVVKISTEVCRCFTLQWIFKHAERKHCKGQPTDTSAFLNCQQISRYLLLIEEREMTIFNPNSSTQQYGRFTETCVRGFLGVGNSRVNPWYQPTDIWWNLGLTRKFSTAGSFRAR